MEGIPASNSNRDLTPMRNLGFNISLVKIAVNIPKGTAKSNAIKVTAIVP